MTIKTKLTLRITSAVAVLLLLCMALICWVSDRTRERAFLGDVKARAATKADLYLQGRLDAGMVRDMSAENIRIADEVEVTVYTTAMEPVCSDAALGRPAAVDSGLFRRALLEGEAVSRLGEGLSLGLRHVSGGRDYVILAEARDEYGHQYHRELVEAMGVLFLVGLVLLFLVSYLLVRSSLKPIGDIVRESNSIAGSEVDRRLPVGNARDEVGVLAVAFNNLLERLEQSFTAQKTFVGNVSHELRTPLAALTAELGLILSKERTTEQYRRAIGHALQDANRMAKLIDGLLNLAKADYQRERIRMQTLRLDELLLDAREFILRAHPQYNIELLFEQEAAEDDSLITVKGNMYLLTIAFSNLIENNCKFSEDNSSFVQISYWDRWTIVRLSDDGIGMSERDLQNLFTLFYRGDRERMVQGHGIGMALSQKIITLHEGNIAVHSEQGKGTTFVVQLPHV